VLFLLTGTFGQLEDGFGDLQDVESGIAGSDQDSYAQTQMARAYQAEQAERAILSQFSDATAGMCMRSVHEPKLLLLVEFKIHKNPISYVSLDRTFLVRHGSLRYAWYLVPLADRLRKSS